MKILYSHNGYHFESYSVVRLLLEELKRRYEVITLISTNRRRADAHMPGCNLSISVGANSAIPSNSPYKVVISFTDPPFFQKWRYDLADLYLSTSLEISREFPGALYLPFYTDERYFRPLDSPKTYDCALIGLGSHPRILYRVEVVDRLREAGLRVLTAGKRWPDHEDNKGFLSGDDLVNAFCSARFSLDITNHTTSQGSRIFQAASCGIPTITLDREDARQHFEPDKEILLYRDANASSAVNTIIECVKNVDAQAVGCNARKRALRDHTVALRVDYLAEELKRRGIE